VLREKQNEEVERVEGIELREGEGGRIDRKALAEAFERRLLVAAARCGAIC